MISDDVMAALELERLAQPSVCPTLTVDEQSLILSQHQRARLWVASTVFQLGAIVVPTLANRNGHRYKAVEYTTTATTQQTGATEPSWSTTRDSQVTDNVIVWQEDGDDWNGNLWDMIAAAKQAWLLKASKASVTSDVVRGELDIKSSQLFDHCMRMSEQFSPVFFL